MAKMYPKDLSVYTPTDSERLVYNALKEQLPDSFEVFYSVPWTTKYHDKLQKSEADFIVTSPDYGYLCLEVKGGSGIRIEDNVWYVEDKKHGDRRLSCSPYAQADKSMYYFRNLFSDKYAMNYQGIFASAAVFPHSILPDNLDNQDKSRTIDASDMNKLYERIKSIFRIAGGNNFFDRFYSQKQHEHLLDLIRTRIAIGAAAGSLVQYKQKQFDVINRVQDNYVYFLNNIRQFFIHGGAGTGKTWIAIKMANKEAEINPGSVLFVCSSPSLAKMVRKHISTDADVYDISTLFSRITDNRESIMPPYYVGVYSQLLPGIKKYHAIFVDEAQDFTEEWAKTIRSLLFDTESSRLGVFYDDAQILRKDSFGDGFGINMEPYLLRENIRNTHNVYSWADKKTNLGRDVITNPIEGPVPSTEVIHDTRQLTKRLEKLFTKYLDDEELSNNSLIILVDNKEKFLSYYSNGIAKWYFVTNDVESRYQIQVASVEEFKGLESDMVIYIHRQTSLNMDYIAYTRAKYYLIELVLSN